MKTVAERLAWARRIAGLSQRRLSSLAGLSTRHVCSLEGGELQGHMREDTAKALARVLGTSASWLAFGEGKRPTEDQIRAAAAAAVAAFGAEGPKRRKAS